MRQTDDGQRTDNTMEKCAEQGGIIICQCQHLECCQQHCQSAIEKVHTVHVTNVFIIHRMST